MLFGNWNVTEKAVVWVGSKFQRFEIPADQLNNTRNNDSGQTTFYDWILIATEEDWLTENDLYDLNYAFVFAMAKYDLEFSYTIFDDTLAEQYEQFENEEREDADL